MVIIFIKPSTSKFMASRVRGSDLRTGQIRIYGEHVLNRIKSSSRIESRII